MPGMNSALQAHLKGGLTTVAHAWAITRNDGMTFGFTDHDRALSFDGITFRADTGLTALALAQSTGLSVDNSEAIGALSDVSIREDEIEQGRFDNAEVRAWLVNWEDVSQRWLQFRGTIGEMRRTDGGFNAELRGLTEALNRPLGRVFQKPCTAVVGDGNCRVNLNQSAFRTDVNVDAGSNGRVFDWAGLPGYGAGWFARGRLEVRDGLAAGLWGMIKNDTLRNGRRVIELWEPLRGSVGSGTAVRLIAGCDKRSVTCSKKFDNYLNYRGFPDVPGDDWVMATPKSTNPNTGGSRR